MLVINESAADLTDPEESVPDPAVDSDWDMMLAPALAELGLQPGTDPNEWNIEAEQSSRTRLAAPLPKMTLDRLVPKGRQLSTGMAVGGLSTHRRGCSVIAMSCVYKWDERRDLVKVSAADGFARVGAG
ncbi:hypothetical protein [Micromonospora haikouensis]|uniref:hypothetical protein n=1 Tax=Micromonospora haikouensis TaxID=686309 RepID=UPI003D71DF1A